MWMSRTRSRALHLGPLLSDADRRYLTCDATCEAWLERAGQPIGAGRATRLISRRLRRALEYRHPTCAVPGCGATRGLHAHHIRHWEDGGATELDNLVLLCPYHHRLHHRGVITITGPAEDLSVSDSAGRALSPASLARPPTRPPPAVAPCPGPTGERADWWWYQPFQPQPQPPHNNQLSGSYQRHRAIRRNTGLLNVSGWPVRPARTSAGPRAPGRIELRRLPRVRARTRHTRAPVMEGRRLRAYGKCVRARSTLRERSTKTRPVGSPLPSEAVASRSRRC